MIRTIGQKKLFVCGRVSPVLDVVSVVLETSDDVAGAVDVVATVEDGGADVSTVPVAVAVAGTEVLFAFGRVVEAWVDVAEDEA